METKLPLRQYAFRSRPLARAVALFALPAILGAGAPLVGSVEHAEAKVFPGNAVLRVEGPLAVVSASPLALTPAFSPSITDYVLRCGTGANDVQITLAATPGGRVNVLGTAGATVVSRESLVENQALIIDWHGPKNPGGTQYWIRCLPHDFPQLKVTKPGNPQAGWYVTGNINSAAGSGTYAFVLDENGTPVWYRKPAGPAAINVTPLASDTIAWITNAGGGFGVDPKGAFEVYDMSTRTTSPLTAPIPPVDLHELHLMSNGDRLMISSPLRADVNLQALGLSPSATIVDCIVEEVNPLGQLVWQWRASDHISIAESTHPVSTQARRQAVYDLFHCNSADADSGTVLISLRQADAVYLINKVSGKIIWKLGGNSVTLDGERTLTILGDPQGAFHAQHDARYQPGGDVSVYDDQSWDPRLAARGVEYHIDAASGTATMVWAYASPDGHNSGATGSFRRLFGGRDNIIGWGFKARTLFTEVDQFGNVLLDVTFPNGQDAYRAIKVPESALSHSLLRATAGLPAFVVRTFPVVSFVGPAIGPTAGGDIVNIIGSGFAGATTVKFGVAAASAFTVQSDNWIAATAPAGVTTVNVTVTTPLGTSAAVVTNALDSTSSDASFEFGTGTWMPGANSVEALSNTVAHTGTHSLRIQTIGPGPTSASSGQFGIPMGASIAGSFWILTPSGQDQVQLQLSFYDSLGTPLGRTAGGTVTTSGSSWTHVSATDVAPPGAAFVAIGVLNTTSSGPYYLDDVILGGPPQHTYGS